MKILIIYTLFFFVSNIGFSQENRTSVDSLKKRIEEVLIDKKVKAGIAINFAAQSDALSFNGSDFFPIFSVVKVPVALAVLSQVDKGKIDLEEKILIKKSDLNPDTYSPMRDARPEGNYEITVKELLRYSIALSDNIAYEKLVERIGGIAHVQKFITGLGIEDIKLESTYKDGLEATLRNVCTPIAANELLLKVLNGNVLSNKSKKVFWGFMRETSTGPDRIKGLLPKELKVEHKTGTGMRTSAGVSLATNDIGVVHLSEQKYFVISVFITDSMEDDNTNALLIAKISEAVWMFYKGQ